MSENGANNALLLANSERRANGRVTKLEKWNLVFLTSLIVLLDILQALTKQLTMRFFRNLKSQ